MARQRYPHLNIAVLGASLRTIAGWTRLTCAAVLMRSSWRPLPSASCPQSAAASPSDRPPSLASSLVWPPAMADARAQRLHDVDHVPRRWLRLARDRLAGALLVNEVNQRRLLVILELLRFELRRLRVDDVLGEIEHVFGQLDVLDLVEIFGFAPEQLREALASAKVIGDADQSSSTLAALAPYLDPAGPPAVRTSAQALWSRWCPCGQKFERWTNL